VKSPESALDYQHVDWDSVPAEQPAEGIERRMIWGERLMMCRLVLQPHVVTAVHSHPHEQMTIVARGRVRFIVDGHDRTASAGDVLLFPANIPHGATMLDEEVELIDIFSPLREDFLPQRPQGR
jgi:quercetin dioxygenase-like cupin family protein